MAGLMAGLSDGLTNGLTDAFTVDADELARVVDRMADCEATMRELADEIEHRIAALHLTWTGVAADAQQRAQAEWQHGFAGMRDALGEMRTAARVAHANYTSAADTNVDMWRQLG